MTEADRTRALERWLQNQLGAGKLVVEEIRPLTGGAIQENLWIGCTIGGREQSFVLRRDAPSVIRESRTRAQEFALVSAAWGAGVKVPRPIGFCTDGAVFGGPFALYTYVGGVGLGPKVVKDQTLGGDRVALARGLGQQLALIHDIDFAQPGLAFLGPAKGADAQREIDAMRATLDALGAHRPSLEWGLRCCEMGAPAPESPVLLHRDFRTGNYMVDHHGLTAVLDWEFAGIGAPMSDLGWFTARCWRFSRPDLEAGGIGDRQDLYAGYAEQAGRAVDHDAVLYWELIAHLRWAVIALEQGHRHASGQQVSLDLALTGRIAAGLEAEILRLAHGGKHDG